MTNRIPHDVAALAEDLNISLPPTPGSERVVTDRYAIWMGSEDHPALTVVQRLRLGDADPSAFLDEVRAEVGRRGRRACTWEIGSSATPAGLEARLLALGLQPWEEPEASGMVLLGIPNWEVPDVTTRVADGLDDHREAVRIFNEAFEPGGEAAMDDAHADRRAADSLADQEAGRSTLYLAELDGAIVAAAKGVPTPAAMVLGAAATRPRFRGRGAYRALVARRAEEARARGAGALVVQAGAMSRPILERLGFVQSCRIRILLDRF
jgi:GNAT superfamily N-acetyltransferase